jgi:hypothetical protein
VGDGLESVRVNLSCQSNPGVLYLSNQSMSYLVLFVLSAMEPVASSHITPDSTVQSISEKF